VSYTLPDGRIGTVERQDIDEHTVAIVVTDDDDLAESTWLKLVGPSTVQHSGPSPLMVSAAFRLIRADAAPQGSAKSTGARIVPEDAADVSIYFPAAKETSGLKFHIHAPFASTVARDSVRDDPSNDQLVRDIGGLITSHLPALRDSGLVNESLLATLPNCDDPLERPLHVHP
jgi:hypothetical protein